MVWVDLPLLFEWLLLRSFGYGERGEMAIVDVLAGEDEEGEEEKKDGGEIPESPCF